MQIDCSLTLTHSLLQNPRDGKKQLHLDICCIVKVGPFLFVFPSSSEFFYTKKLLSITRHRTSSRFRQAIDFISNLATSPLALILCKQS
ncbi:hypothetical protein FOXYSP1_03094 [Fusarium oxysporum f. sp. phaseoli]